MNHKQAFGLVDLYIARYQQIYGKSPQINKFRDKWGMVDVLATVSYTRAVQVIDYYFQTDKKNHPYNWMLTNFDKLDKALAERDADREHRAKLREETAKRVAEWEKMNEPRG